ncbi:surface antigen [Sphingopyxis sp. BE122]|nr:surface antigen [Sphingopyxis sp. BE122]
MMRKYWGAPAVLAAWMLAVAPAQAQFGGLLRKVTTPAPKPSEEGNGGCPKGKKGSSIGRNILGNVLNDAVGDAASKAGVYSYVPISEVSGTLTDAIACRLDPAEQVQAAAATEEVTRGEAVGATSNWTSATRPEVSGSSTVASINDERGGRRCMNVTDFIIVEGEETRVTKRMCKEPGQARYVVAA